MSDDEQTAMIRETVAKFVDRELIPLEPQYLKSKLPGSDHPELTSEQRKRLRDVSKELGLWGLDAPEDLGGHDLPTRTMAAVHEELGRSCVPFVLPPDSPNLRMLQAVGTEAQKKKYMQPYIEGRMVSAIAISEPGAGGDPAGMKTRAVLEGEQWVLNGRKIWISNARAADFIIVMARIGNDQRQGGITSFIVEKGTAGFIIEREIPMVGGGSTYEIVFEDCRIPKDSVLGEVGKGYAPMQLRLRTRRLEMGSTCVGITKRALDMMCEHAKQRETFGVRLAERQAIQWWIADISTRMHACRLMVREAADKTDRGEDIRHEASMIKVFATEMAYDACDHAMQTLGALGVTLELPLNALWQKARLMRVYEGPSEVHRQAIARRVLGLRGG
ncbi:acyl-CoA/acyl-ACP dehydrogenase [Bradyrhizobium viridifuturi]|jgi:alkylation response protein AidB-like acyl-CoA dehydrogenase|uniref:acyl-CoA dehydrogenase family protein n=3 Tax=Nitrobacteraceae TaxID=41294 RepID=UPI000397407A|nr:MULTISPECIES: acyl-CoA dehydrogenase family protein [Bradyrhizobium]ERF81482.1 MAG: Holliday junction DNA helicase RuvB [Bradyrhizobium sp. DFCI-1]OYU59860.1 MAG: acyl-CoA dehydrogenase [Bradyrhizobium sp. PARBB1]PSO28531.1 acyl-CoA dehydrogenase [Bradyrhizobium sp. MOS004]QRI72561.1 acyl-CoA/acyl-ACP dehydrogenase [Bradyrhizobium sp. PSBB068]MBR1021137.1 acyl-CoA/acyl-ACP dehydrogenase [Bradyrhizobium viridifuturi]